MYVFVLNEIVSKKQHFKIGRNWCSLPKVVVAVRNMRLTTVQHHTVQVHFLRPHWNVSNTHTINSPTIDEFCAPHKPITALTIVQNTVKKKLKRNKKSNNIKTILCVDSLTLEQSINILYSIQTWWNQSTKIHLLSNGLREYTSSELKCVKFNI